jgi:hypothetical protein
VGAAYARRLQGCFAAFTDSSKYQYVVAKYFEIPATGCLLVADDTVKSVLRRLGFIEHMHYVPVSKLNLEASLEWVLHPGNRPLLDMVRERAQRLVLDRHLTGNRAQQIDRVCSMD